MSDTLKFKKLTEVNETEEVLDSDTVFVERDGVIYRVSKDKVGGSGTYVLKPKLEDFVLDDNTGIMTVSTNYDDLAKAMEKGMSIMILFPAGLNNNPVPMIMTVIGMTYVDENFAEMSQLPSSGVMLMVEMYEQIFLPNGSYVPML